MGESFMQNTIPRMLAEQVLGMKYNRKANKEGGRERNQGRLCELHKSRLSENTLHQRIRRTFNDPGTLKGAERGGKSGGKLKRSGDSVN